jgi:hypothetical protein
MVIETHAVSILRYRPTLDILTEKITSQVRYVVVHGRLVVVR